MILAMCAKIHLPASRVRGAIDIYKLSEVSMEDSIKKFTSIATVTLPRRVKTFDRYKVTEVFQCGDPIEIYLGYNGVLVKEFSGFIAQVFAGIPIRLKCEDQMWKLKKGEVSYTSANAKLKQLLGAVVKDVDIVCDDIELGAVRYSKVAPINVLEDLKKKTSILCSHFIDGKLVVGQPYSINSNAAPIDVYMERMAVSEDLKQKESSDVEVKITALQKGGKKLQVKIGEGGGRTISLSGNFGVTEATLKMQAKTVYEKAKQPGFDGGGVVLFGIPRVQIGMRINLISDLYPERNGLYYVDAVKKSFSPEGYRQNVELGDKMS